MQKLLSSSMSKLPGLILVYKGLRELPLDWMCIDSSGSSPSLIPQYGYITQSEGCQFYPLCHCDIHDLQHFVGLIIEISGLLTFFDMINTGGLKPKYSQALKLSTT